MINIGIDFGTSNSCIATLRSGEPKVIPSAEGSATTPSVVAFLPSGQRIVGVAAKRQALKNAPLTVSSVKRLLGRLLSEVEEEVRHLPQSLQASETGAVRLLLGEEEVSPEQIASLVFAKLKTDAEEFYGEEVGGAVLTVPAHWGDVQRQSLKQAAEAAGINVLGIVNEPTAAALAYGFGFEEAARRTIVVFDLGGGTFDVSAVAVEDGDFQVLATSGDNNLGGDDFDMAIVDFLLNSASEQGIVLENGDPLLLQRLQEAAEQAKIDLSTLEETNISIPFISSGPQGPEHLETTLLRADLEVMIAPLLERLTLPIQECLAASRLQPSAIDDVVLVGGMTRMPAVKHAVENLLGRLPKRGVDTGQAVALGAAIRAASLSGELESGALQDVTPLSLGLEVITGMTEHLISGNTPLPASCKEIFSTASDDQSSVELRVVQGERSRASDNRLLGKVSLRGIAPAPAYIPQIEVSFELDENGILRVGAKDLDSGIAHETVVESVAGLSAHEIEVMKQEATTYAVKDKELRERAKLRNEARALRQQGITFSGEMTAALDQLDAALEDGEIEELRAAYQQVVQAHDAGAVEESENVPLAEGFEPPVRSAPEGLF
jgi:molecular chaperone DnaK